MRKHAAQIPKKKNWMNPLGPPVLCCAFFPQTAHRRTSNSTRKLMPPPHSKHSSATQALHVQASRLLLRNRIPGEATVGPQRIANLVRVRGPERHHVS